MKAQVYFNDPKDPHIRIFPKGFSLYVAELPIRSKNFTTQEADKTLHTVGFRRRQKWEKTPWGYEAPVRFKEKRNSNF